MRILFALMALLMAAAPVPAREAHWWETGPALPTLSGRVVDDAGLLSRSERSALAARLARLEAATRHQFVVVTVPRLHGQTIETFGVRLGRTWGIGRKGVNDGVLLIVAPNERKVRIEVGTGVENRLTDRWCGRIIRQVIVPRFEAGDMAGGISDGAAAIIERLQARH